MVSLKQIAMDFGVDQRLVRAMLRLRYGRASGRRWKWTEEEAQGVRKWLAECLSKGGCDE
jgi:hypothetical protein